MDFQRNSNISIALYDAKPYDVESFKAVNAAFGYHIEYFDFKLNSKTASTAKGYDVVCAFVNDKIDEKTAQQLVEQGTKLIAMRCAGYNNLDLNALWEKIPVVRVPAYSPYSVAEHATALLLAVTRKIPQSYSRTHNGNFVLSGLTGRDLHGLTAGIVGTGKIGRVLGDILSGFGMKIVAYDPFPNEAWTKERNVTYMSIDELFTVSDVMSLHCPLTKETFHIVDEKALTLMKDDAVIINTGRGALIDTPALVQALKDKKIGGAALDVYEEEDDYFFEDWSGEIIQDDTLSRLLSFPNVIVTSHQAFLTSNALQSIAETTLQNITDFYDHKPLQNEICYRCGQQPGQCSKALTGRCFFQDLKNAGN